MIHHHPRRPTVGAPGQTPTVLALFIGLAALMAGSGRACALPADAQRLAEPHRHAPPLNQDNPRTAEMLTTGSLQANTDPVTYTARVHRANAKVFRQTAVNASLRQGWLLLPQPPGYTSPPDTFVLPQADLPKLAAVEADPIGQVTALAESPPRAPSAGPLVTARLQVKPTSRPPAHPEPPSPPAQQRPCSPC